VVLSLVLSLCCCVVVVCSTCTKSFVVSNGTLNWDGVVCGVVCCLCVVVVLFVCVPHAPRVLLFATGYLTGMVWCCICVLLCVSFCVLFCVFHTHGEFCC